METDVFQGRLRLHFHPDWPGVHHLKILGLLQVSSLHWKKRSWISRCCCLHLFLPSWFLALQDSQRCCSENPKGPEPPTQLSWPTLRSCWSWTRPWWKGRRGLGLKPWC
ncbi:uncharacterized protein LOC129039306 isoform X5 [Pongo pygmaeus]|uniref:uncharacterized protein LOC129039306 isoform X5 n=1 Tax=Pongo pygmaeus TaxID=9600 RepID=UPI00300DA721